MQKTAYRYHFFQGRIFVFFVSKRTIFHSVQTSEQTSLGITKFISVRWSESLPKLRFFLRYSWNFNSMRKSVISTLYFARLLAATLYLHTWYRVKIYSYRARWRQKERGRLGCTELRFEICGKLSWRLIVASPCLSLVFSCVDWHSKP